MVTFRGVMVYLSERVTMLTNRLRQGTGSIKRLKQQAEEWARKQGKGVRSIYKPGWSRERVLSIPKPNRPNPSEYLHQDYIDAHLAKFEKGGSYLVPKEALDRFGRDPIGRPDGQFIMSKTEMDALLKKSNGDMSVVEKELGIPEGLWKGKEMVRIDIPDPKSLDLRMPTGNEAGANELLRDLVVIYQQVTQKLL